MEQFYYRNRGLSVTTLGSVHSLVGIQMMTNGLGLKKRTRQTKKQNGNLPIEQKKCGVLYDKRQDNSQLYNTEIEKIAQNLSLPAVLSKIAKMCSVCNRPSKNEKSARPPQNNQISKIPEKIDESRRQKKKSVCAPFPALYFRS